MGPANAEHSLIFTMKNTHRVIKTSRPFRSDWAGVTLVGPVEWIRPVHALERPGISRAGQAAGVEGILPCSQMNVERRFSCSSSW